jgi:putative ABC transport system permease protein
VSPDVAVHLVVGAKGSRFDLVLHALYSIDPPSGGPVPYRFYKKFISYKNDQGQRIEGEMSPFVKVAVPYCLGDSYRGFRVIGTTPDMCGGAIPVKRPGKELGAPEFADGRNFRQEEFFSAVIGSVVAEKCGLKVGDQIQPAHGTDEGSATHAKKFHVTGVLKPTGSSIDRSVYINLEGFYLLEGHALPPDGDGPKSKDVSVALVDGDKIDGKTFVPLPEERREVSAILVIAKDDTTAMALRDGINEGSEAVAASSVRVLIEFLTGGRSRFYELGIALKLSGGKLDRKQFSTGLQLRPIDGRK